MKRLTLALLASVLAVSLASAQDPQDPVLAFTEVMYNGTGTPLFRGCFIDSLNGWIVGLSYKTVLRTRDGGHSWQESQLSTPPQLVNFYSVYFADTLNGWVVGSSGYSNGPGTIIRTTDGGRTWQQQLHPASNSRWLAIARVGSELWVGGTYFDVGHDLYYGLLLRSSDSGRTWRLRDFPQQGAFRSLAVLDSSHIWIAGEKGTLLETTNGGGTWVDHRIDTTIYLSAVKFAGPSHGYAVGYGITYPSAYLYRTSDSGITWQQIYSNPNVPDLVSIGVVGKDTLYGGMQQPNRLVLSYNGGATWSEVYAPATVTECSEDIIVLDRNHIWAVNDNSIISFQYSAPVNHRPVLEVGEDSVAYGGTSYRVSYLAYDTDPGDWVKVTLDYSVTPLWLAVDSVNSQVVGRVPIPMIGTTFRYRVVATDSRGDSLSFTSKPIRVDKASKVEVDAGISSEVSLSQNYPNPFNPSTIIRFEIPVTGHVSLKIYDLLGREVERLKDEVLTPGNYSTQWTPRTSPSGVYFYRLVVGQHADTKKLLFVR